MQVSSQIDKQSKSLPELNSLPSEKKHTDAKKFPKFLQSSLKPLEADVVPLKVANTPLNTQTHEIPNWVNPNYGYDPQNPRKPNMLELMEAMAGKDVEDLYTANDERWDQISHQASDILYGVVGANEDTRDWLYIMESKDVLTKAREQTGAMYEPEVNIRSNFNQKGTLTEQTAIIKDSKGNTLASLSNNITSAEETLRNFGATKDCIPANLEDQVDPEIFDNNLLTFLKNFDKEPASIEQILFQSTSEVIANKISQEIPLDELAKL